MNKLLLTFISLIVWQISYAQGEKLEIDGAIIVSDSEAPNPEEGTIRWTGQDFEGFDGNVWKSLTSCESDELNETVELICPSSTITDPNFLTQVIHTNPSSQVVKYDLWVNGEDAGSAYPYDPSKTIQTHIWDLSEFLSGSGTATFELFYFYDNDFNTLIFANSCIVDYDFTNSSAVHDCFGFDLIQKIDSYVKPNFSCTPDQVFTSVSALIAKINSMTDHGGAVYQLAGGTYNTPIEILNKRNLTLCSDPANPAILDIQNSKTYGIQINQTNGTSENISVTGFKITRTRYHGIWVGNDSTGDGGGDIYIGGNHIYDAGNTGGAAITIRENSPGKMVTIEGNEIERIGLEVTGNSGKGEGIYIGSGSDGSLFADNVIIRGNYIHDMEGEAIDIKRHSRNILIEYNRIEDIGVFSQGAITLALDNRKGGNNYDANFVVRRNCISNVSRLDKDGEGIVVANGNALIEENLIYNIFNNAVDVYNDADGPGKTVTIKNNIFWNYGNMPVRENYGSGNGGPNNPFTVIRQNNIVDSDPDSNECLESATIFRGPLTSKAGFSPQ